MPFFSTIRFDIFETSFSRIKDASAETGGTIGLGIKWTFVYDF